MPCKFKKMFLTESYFSLPVLFSFVLVAIGRFVPIGFVDFVGLRFAALATVSIVAALLLEAFVS